MAFRVALGLFLLLLPAPAIAQDLTGTWRFRTISAVTDHGLACTIGSVTFNSAGAVTAGSRRDCSGAGALTPLGGGTVTLGVNGTLAGTAGGLVVQGNLLPGGRAFVASLSTSPAEPSGFGVFVKDTTTSYGASDLAGTWQVRLLDGGALPARTSEQATGTIEIGPAGVVTGGTLTFFSASEGTSSRPIVGGTASIDGDGVVTGTVLTLDGAVTTSATFSGLMTADKALVGTTFRTTGGVTTETGLALLQRSGPAARTLADVAGQWTLSLLLVDPLDAATGLGLAGVLDIDAGGGTTGTLIDPQGLLTPVRGLASIDGQDSVGLALDVLPALSALILDGTLSPDGAHVAGTLRTTDGQAPATVVSLGLLSMVKHEVSTVQPGTFRLDRSTYTVSESAASVAIVVRRSGTSLAGNDAVRYATADGTATSGGAAPDYVATSGTLTFGPGQTARTITVPLRKDGRVDGDRTFTLALTAAPDGGAVVAPASALVTIKDVDLGGVVRLASATYAVAESAGHVTLTVLRSGGAAGGVLVDFTTADRTATGGVEGEGDFERTSGTLSFGAGNTSATITIPIRQDALAEGPETFRVQLDNVRGGATLGAPAAATVTIVDDEPAVQLEAASASVLESARAAVVRVRRTGPLAGTATVAYAATGGTAVAGRDFTAVAGTLTFPPNTASKSFTVPVLDNTRLDGDRIVQITLSAPTGAQLGPLQTATLTIRDDEQAGTFTLDRSAYSVRESAGSLPVTIRRAGSHLAGNVSVTLVTTDGTGPAGAHAGADYGAMAAVVAFAAGEQARTVHVPILVDDAVEGTETFGIALVAPGSGATLGSPASATVSIQDDSSVLEFSGRFCTTAACTGNGNSPEVVRTGSLTGTVSARYRAVSGTATLGEDFSLAPGVVVFPPGVRTRLLPLVIAGDSIAEGGETLRLELFDPSPNARLGENATLTATIADDDFGGVVQFAAASQPVAAAALAAGTNVSVTIVRTGGAGKTLTVGWQAVGGTLAPSPAAGSVTFGPRDTSRRFTLSVLNPDPVDRTVVLGLSFPQGAARLGAPATTTLLVPAAPPAPAVLQLDRADYAVDEGGTAMLTVTRTGNLAGSVTVELVTTPGTATPGADYAAVSGVLTLADGVASATIAVPTEADALDDTPQTFGVALRNPSANARLGTPSSAVVTITAPLPPPVPYSVAPIAFAGGQTSFSTFTGVPAINDAGAVAFAGTLPGEDVTLWIGTAGGPTLRAVATAPAGGGLPHDRFPIDAGGHVVFDATDGTGESALYSVFDGQEPVLLLQTDTSIRGFGPPALDRTGLLAFTATLADGRRRLSAGPRDGALAIVAEAPGPAFAALGDRPAAGGGTTVAFLAEPAAGGGTALFTASLAGATPDVRAVVTGDRFAFDGRVAINAGGAVAFAGAPATGAPGVFVVRPDGSVTTVVTAGAAFAAFGAEGEDATPQINDAGQVAFLAFLAGGGHGIFTGPDPLRDKVIRTGDVLDGSAVSAVELGGLDGAGQVVFRAWLEDGRQVIAIATPPPAQADLGIAQSVDVATPAAGDTVTFTVTASNQGPGTAPDVLVQDMLPSGYDLVSSASSQGTTLLFMGRMLFWSVGSLPASGPSSTATLTIVARVRAAGDHATTATIGSAIVTDPDPTNNSATATVTPLP